MYSEYLAANSSLNQDGGLQGSSAPCRDPFPSPPPQAIDTDWARFIPKGVVFCLGLVEGRSEADAHQPGYPPTDESGCFS